MNEVDLYSFVYRGILTEEALDSIGRKRRSHFGGEEARAFQKTLSFDFLEVDLLADAQQMAVVYTALHAFENAVRAMVTKAMGEKHGDNWWEKSPDRIKKQPRVEWRKIRNFDGMGRVEQ